MVMLKRRAALAVALAFLTGIVLAGGAFAAYELTIRRDGGVAPGPDGGDGLPPSANASPSDPNAPAGNVDPAELRGLLLPVRDVDRLLQTSGMIPQPVSTEFAFGSRATPSDCLSVWVPSARSTYSHLTTTGAASQAISEEPKSFHHAIQGVASFTDTSTARTFFNQQVSQWAQCQSQGVDVHYTDGTKTEHVEAGIISIVSDMVTMPVIPEVAPDWPLLVCDHALAVRRNVVVDVRVCTPTNDHAGATLARTILDKIPE